MYTIIDRISNQEIEGLKVQKILHAPGFELLSVGLGNGEVFPEHTSPTEAALLVLRGNIVFHIGGRTFELTEEELFHIPAGTPHWVEGHEDSKFLIIR